MFLSQKYHRDLPASKVYAFGRSKAEASVPGPTIVAESGYPIRVQWVNNITDDRHFLPVDHTLMAPVLKKGGVPIGKRMELNALLTAES